MLRLGSRPFGGRTFSLFGCAVLLMVTVFLAGPVRAADLITNGSFETGNFTGWTATNASSAWRLWAVSPSGAGGDDGSGYTPVPTATVVQHGTRSAWNGVTAGANSPFILSQDVTIPAGQTVSVQWIDRYQLNYTQFCGSGANPCGTASYFVEITNTSGTVLQTLYNVNTANNSNSNTGYVTHYALLGTTYAGQTIRLRFRTVVTSTLEGPGQVEIDNVRLNAPAVLNPTAADVSVSGRVLTSDGAGIAHATVTMTDPANGLLTAITNAFGYYTFTEIPTGQTYILAVNSKKYVFADSPRAVNVQDDLTDVNFIAAP
jgi:Carboxypeptidase regulatory-like domain